MRLTPTRSWALFVFCAMQMLQACRTGEGPGSGLLDDPVSPPVPSEDQQTAFAPTDVRFSPVDPVEEGILTALDTVDLSADIAMYSLGDKDILDKLEALATAGKKIRLILNKARTCGSKCTKLEEAGVDVKFINPVMHHKFAIIDGNQSGTLEGAVVITGSANWSSSAFTMYDEDWLRFDGQEVFSRAFQGEFNRLWAHSRDFPGPAAGAENLPLAGTTNHEDILFTSANMRPNANLGSFKTIEGSKVVTRRVVGLFDAATETIDVAHAHFRTPEIFDALKRAHLRGVKIRILLDQQEYRPGAAGDPDSTLFFEETLAESGVDLRYKVYAVKWDYRTAKQLHTKFSIIDSKIVITGSYNWSVNAETKTMENMIVLRHLPSVLEYRDRFDALFAMRREHYQAALDDIVAQGRTSPCHMEPIAMSLSEFKTYRDTFLPGACP